MSSGNRSVVVLECVKTLKHCEPWKIFFRPSFDNPLRGRVLSPVCISRRVQSDILRSRFDYVTAPTRFGWGACFPARPAVSVCLPLDRPK